MQVVRKIVATVEALETAQAHVLANLANQAFAHIFQGGAKAILAIRQGAQGVQVTGVVLRNQLSRGTCHGQKAVVFGHEVGFAVELDQ